MLVDVAFITVNYNTRALVEELIRFFKATTLPFSYRFVVVDNNSTDGSRELLEQEDWEPLLYLQTNENLGYGRGMNRGLAAIDCRYACIMNTDLILNQEALTALWHFFECSPAAGVAAPVILGADHRIQGFIFSPGILSLYSQLYAKVRIKQSKLRVLRAATPLQVPGVMGAFFMFRRSSFTNGLFDEDFFFYYEDTELAHRYWHAGIKCYVLPQVSIVHLGGQSTSAEGGRLFQVSRKLYILKTYGKFHASLLGVLDRLRLYGKFLKYYLLRLIFSTEKINSKYDFYARIIEDG